MPGDEAPPAEEDAGAGDADVRLQPRRSVSAPAADGASQPSARHRAPAGAARWPRRRAARGAARSAAAAAAFRRPERYLRAVWRPCSLPSHHGTPALRVCHALCAHKALTHGCTRCHHPLPRQPRSNSTCWRSCCRLWPRAPLLLHLCTSTRSSTTASCSAASRAPRCAPVCARASTYVPACAAAEPTSVLMRCCSLLACRRRPRTSL